MRTLLGSCNFDAIFNENSSAVKELDMKIAEYSKAVVDGRPNFHINLVIDVSPYCDCHGENDVPILPDIGMFASFDPVALDQACVDACNAQNPLREVFSMIGCMRMVSATTTIIL